jgi:hypothetical protein
MGCSHRKRRVGYGTVVHRILPRGNIYNNCDLEPSGATKTIAGFTREESGIGRWKRSISVPDLLKPTNFDVGERLLVGRKKNFRLLTGAIGQIQFR